MRRVTGLLRIVGLVALVAIVARAIDPAVVRRSWEGLPIATLAWMVVAWHAAAALRVARWAFQARAAGFGFGRRAIVREFLWALLLGVVTPLRAGELYRLRGIDVGERRTEAAALIVWEKGIEALTLATFAVAGAWWVFAARRLAIALGAGLLAGAIIALGPVPFGPLARARDALSPSGRLVFVVLTLCAQLLNMAAGARIYLAFGALALDRLFLGLPMVTLSAAIPVTVSGVGLRELLAMRLFGDDAFPADAAAVAATASFLGAHVLPTLWIAPFEAAVWLARRDG